MSRSSGSLAGALVVLVGEFLQSGASLAVSLGLFARWFGIHAGEHRPLDLHAE
jgi:hypothetical protein